MEIVLDINVIVSALMSEDSPPDRIIRAWRRKAFGLVTSPVLLAELEEVLLYPRVRSRLPFGDDAIREFLTQLRTSANIVSPNLTVEAIERDPDDNRILEAAVSGSADFIVSGDKAMRALGRYEGIDIVTPARFVEIMSI